MYEYLLRYYKERAKWYTVPGTSVHTGVQVVSDTHRYRYYSLTKIRVPWYLVPGMEQEFLSCTNYYY